MLDRGARVGIPREDEGSGRRGGRNGRDVLTERARDLCLFAREWRVDRRGTLMTLGEGLADTMVICDRL